MKSTLTSKYALAASSLRPLLISLILLVILAMISTSCQKTDKEHIIPGIQPIPPALHLHVMDKTTGKDLFIGNTATFTLDDIHLFSFINDSVNHRSAQEFSIDYTNNQLYTGFSSRIVYLKIGDLPGDTITALSISRLREVPPFVDSILLNGHTYAADASHAFTIKK